MKQNGTSTQEEVEQLRQQYCNLYIDDEFGYLN